MSAMEIKIQRISTEEEKRIIALSDIHGEVTYLDGVLKKAGYTTEDILIIVGDLIEKGRESLKTVRYVMELAEHNPNVYVTMGNVDFFRIQWFLDDSREGNEDFIGGLRWSREFWGNGFFLDILDELGVDLYTLNVDNIMAVKADIRSRYARELAFLQNLPTMLAIGNFIFVHGGIPTDRIEELVGEEAFPFLKRDKFLEQDVHFEKTVVVGHWPACLYRKDILSMNPVFDYGRHIISMDGGCGLKREGQLNALLLPGADASMEEVRFVSYDDFPVVVAAKAQEGRSHTIRTSYNDDEVEVLSEADGVARVRRTGTGKEFDIIASFLYSNEGKTYCGDFTDALLTVAEGDEISVIGHTKAGIYGKKDGIVGWYYPKDDKAYS